MSLLISPVAQRAGGSGRGVARLLWMPAERAGYTDRVTDGMPGEAVDPDSDGAIACREPAADTVSTASDVVVNGEPGRGAAACGVDGELAVEVRSTVDGLMPAGSLRLLRTRDRRRPAAPGGSAAARGGGYPAEVLVLLPPSETKAPGGAGPVLDLDGLSFPELTPIRRKLIEALVDLAADVPASLGVLGLSPRQEEEVARNAALLTARTLPALERYTGVLYDALDFGAFTRSQRAKAEHRLAIASALFGVLRGGDRIPAYRLSGGTSLPAVGTLRALWRPILEPALAGLNELVVDLRSGAYAALARIPDAVSVRVVTETGKTISHHNKAFKGKLAAVLATASREPSTVDGLVRTAARAGIRLSRTGEHELELITPR